MKHNYFWGCDPGLVTDPTGTVLLRVTRPAVVVQEGRVLDAVTGEQMAVPEGVTLAEFVAPKFDVVDVQSRQGLTFGQTAREARSVMEDMGGSNFMAVVDSTGLGVGAVDAIRRAGVPCIGVTLTAGSRITGSRWSVNLPVSLMFAAVFSIMSQNRLRVTNPAGAKLIEELKEIEKRVSDAGRESYDVATGQGHHGDLCYALGMALIIAERRVGRQSRTVALNPEGHQRKAGRPGRGKSAARQVIDARLEASRREAERSLWAQIGQDKDPGFE